MKKKLTLATLIAVIGLLTACSAIGSYKQIFDMTYSYNRAILYLPNGEVIDGKVDSWTDYEDGDQIQVKINDKTYLVHSSNIVLISE